MHLGTNARKASSSRQHWMAGTDIGLVEGGCRLNCSINLTERSFIYFKSNKEIIACLASFDKRIKRWAFRRIQNYSHYQKENSRSMFLPEQLMNGNLDVLPTFLQQLKNQRIESYIRFKLPQPNSSFSNIHKMASVLNKFMKRRQSSALLKITANYLQKCETMNAMMVLAELNNATTSSSKIENPHYVTPEKSSTGRVSISYTKIRLNPEKQHTLEGGKTQSMQRMGRLRKFEDVSISRIEQSSLPKEYRFEAAAGRWSKTPIKRK